MGKGSKPIIGFHYRPAFHHGLTTGPIDAFLEFRGGDRTAWRGTLTASGTISVNAPRLFGGEKDQGGIVGSMDVMFGEATQQPNAYLLSTFGDQVPAWRGFTTVVWKGGRYGAMNPYPQKASYKMRRVLQGWDGGTAWYPAKAEIQLTDGFVTLLGAGWEYVVQTFSEPNTDWDDFTVPTEGWVQGGELPFSTNGMAGGEYWTPTRSNIWLRRQMSVSTPGLTLNIGADNGCVVWVDGVNVGSSNPANDPIPSNENNPVSFDFTARGTVEVVVKAFAEIDAANEAGNIVDLSFTGAPLIAANPAHVLYESRTCMDMGREPTSSINDASLTAAADKLFAEGFGICTKWDPSAESVEDFENRISRLIGGSFNRSIENGQWYLDLARGDYVLEDLPILTDDDILEFKEQPSTLDSAINSVSVRYFDPERKESIVTPPVRALGLVAAFGTIHQTFDFPEIPVGGLATRVAKRELLAVTTPTRTFDLVTTRKTYSWRPNTYFRLQSTKRGIADMVCLVGSKQSGTLKSGAIKMVATQDIYSLPETSFVEVEHGVDPSPNQTPTPITLQRAEEAPYIEVVAAMTRADLAALPADAGFAMAMASTAGTDLDFTMMVAPDGGVYEEAAQGQWCATATVVEAAELSGALSTAFTLADGIRLDEVEVGMPAMWGTEICRVDAIDADAGTVTLGRGCADTVPVEHAAGERIWFYQVAFAYDDTEYTDGEAIDVKLLSNTGSQQLAEGDATTIDLTFDQRQARPYPPGQFTINAQSYPASIEGTEVTVAWVHRDRVLQADQLVDTSEAGVGPEAGTTYNVRYFLNDLQVSSETGISGTAATLFDFGSTGTGRVELESQRGSLVSWQMFSHEFTMNAPAQFVALPLTYDEADASATMTWTRQGNGPHVTPMGFEGDGYEARLKSTTIPAWMTSASAVLTMHASISFYPQELKSTSEFVVFAGDTTGSAAKLILCVVPDATNADIAQLALRGGGGEKRLGRSNWQYQFRVPDLTIGGYEARPQSALFIDATTLIVGAHYENTMSRVWKINPSTAEVLGYFDCTVDWLHVALMAKRANGDVWMTGGGKMCRVDLDASFSSGALVFDAQLDYSAMLQLGGLEFVTVGGTEYMVMAQYLTAGTPYVYVFDANAVFAAGTIAAGDRYKRFTGNALETQGIAMRSAKLVTSSNDKAGAGGASRYGYVHVFDLMTAITSTADGGALTLEATYDAATKYAEDVAVHPSTNDLWMGSEGITAVGSDDGALSWWSSPLDGSLVGNHYTCEYDGAASTTIKVNGRPYDTMAATLTQDVLCVTIGGDPDQAASMTGRFFTGFVRNVVLQDQPMTSTQYAAAVNGDHEPNSLTAYEFTLTNPGGESGSTTGWTNEAGGLGVLQYPAGTATVPHGGSYFFSGGTSASTIARQRLDILAQTGLTGPDVDAGGIWAKVRWWQASFDSATDPAGMGLRTLTSGLVSQGEAYAGIAWTPNSSGTYRPWYPRCLAHNLPSGARSLDALQKVTRTAGTNNDGWIDDITVTVYRQ